MTSPRQPAFPSLPTADSYLGLSFREYAATAIMARLCGDEKYYYLSAESKADDAVSCADALIAALQRGSK
jgi:phage gp36-like protein